MIAIGGGFCGPGGRGVVGGSCGGNGSLLAWGWPFLACGGGVALHSGAYAAGGLRWGFACGFGFGHRL